MCLVTRTSIGRCEICLWRLTPGGAPWPHPTGNWCPTLPSTTQVLVTPPQAHMETAGGPNITPTPSDSVQLATHSLGREDWTMSTDTTPPTGRKYSKLLLCCILLQVTTFVTSKLQPCPNALCRKFLLFTQGSYGICHLCGVFVRAGLGCKSYANGQPKSACTREKPSWFSSLSAHSLWLIRLQLHP